MKLSALILAALMTAGSATAFAEGGGERVKEYFANLQLDHEQVQTTSGDSHAAESASTTDTQQPARQKSGS